MFWYSSSSAARSQHTELGDRDDVLERRVFLFGLPVDTTEDEILMMMSRFGEVRGIFLPTGYMTRRHRGFGFVEFASVMSATRAIEKSECNELRIRPNVYIIAHAAEQPRLSMTVRPVENMPGCIRVDNLRGWAMHNTLRHYFGRYGHVIHVQILRVPGFLATAFVYFFREAAAAAAVSAHNNNKPKRQMYFQDPICSLASSSSADNMDSDPDTPSEVSASSCCDNDESDCDIDHLIPPLDNMEDEEHARLSPLSKPFFPKSFGLDISDSESSSPSPPSSPSHLPENERPATPKFYCVAEMAVAYLKGEPV
jgi:hypothetical protein